jgi:hypothetical protein
MAKELPYFKFEPAEYIAGNIQDCSFDAQGVFVNICSLYWIRLGELAYASALQRICKGNEIALQELIKNHIFKLEDGQIVIDFLDNQLNEFQETSQKRRDAANKRWEDASALQVECKSNAIREEKRREDEIKEDKIKEKERVDLPWSSENFKGIWNDWKQYKKEQFKFNYKNKSETAALTELLKLSSGDESVAIKIIHQSLSNGWKGFFELKKNGRETNQAGEYLRNNDPDYKNY